MKPFTQHRGIAAPMMSDNIDTDQIIPSREMKKVSKVGLGEGLFSGQRFHFEGTDKVGENADFVLNQPGYRGASILLTGKNFGCGSSREHAVWALTEYGFTAIVAESFGTIFRNNCLRNGLLPITLPANAIQQLADSVAENPVEQTLLINLEHCTIQDAQGKVIEFECEPYFQKMLLNGWDFIDLALQYESAISTFIAADQQQRPWAYL